MLKILPTRDQEYTVTIELHPLAEFQGSGTYKYSNIISTKMHLGTLLRVILFPKNFKLIDKW